MTPPIAAGQWPAGQGPTGRFPDKVAVGGVVLERSRWSDGRGVAQYRAPCARNSAHLVVSADGTWTIDHLDSWNPDAGFPIRHFFCDTIAGRAVVVLATVAAVAAATYGGLRFAAGPR